MIAAARLKFRTDWRHIPLSHDDRTVDLPVMPFNDYAFMVGRYIQFEAAASDEYAFMQAFVTNEYCFEAFVNDQRVKVVLSRAPTLVRPGWFSWTVHIV